MLTAINTNQPIIWPNPATVTTRQSTAGRSKNTYIFTATGQVSVATEENDLPSKEEEAEIYRRIYSAKLGG